MSTPMVERTKAIKKLNARLCLKCNGTMVPESVDTVEGFSRTLRCVMCGEVVDPVILENRWKRDAA